MSQQPSHLMFPTVIVKREQFRWLCGSKSQIKLNGNMSGKKNRDYIYRQFLRNILLWKEIDEGIDYKIRAAIGDFRDRCWWERGWRYGRVCNNLSSIWDTSNGEDPLYIEYDWFMAGRRHFIHYNEK